MQNISKNENAVPMHNLSEIAEESHIQVDSFPLPKTKSISITDGTQYFIAIDPLEIRTTAEWNTHFAHEIGHCETGSFYNLHAPLDIRQKHELVADKWAVHHLIPQAWLEQALCLGYKEVWELADYFDVTEAFGRRALYIYYECPPMK